MSRFEIEEPECSYGYPWSQLERMLDTETFKRLQKWMYGQTMALCEGKRYNRDSGEYEATGHAHGGVVYRGDFERFIEGRPVID